MIDLSLPWQVIHGDCLEVMRQLPDGCVDAVVTDPPYGIGADPSVARPFNTQRQNGMAPRKWDSVAPSLSHCFVAPTVAVWGGNYFELPVTRGWLAWTKPDAPPSMGTVELCWTNRNANAKHISHSIGATNAERCGHPTQKPLRVMQWTIAKLSIPEGGLIVDPYCGSGTTGVAAVRMGHRFIGIEREAAYVDIARRRIADAASQTKLDL
jgi:site-specific DNA-methyltransferase (adenine-specific)